MNVDRDVDRDDDAYWIKMAGSRWTRPKLTAPKLASLLGIGDPANLRRQTPGLPEPAQRDTDEWSLQQAYDYILMFSPDRGANVPRLYPFTSALTPAGFLFGQVVDGFAVHAWQPGDGRGPIAVAYGGPEHFDTTLYEKAGLLLKSLPWATAVCCPSAEVCRAPDHADQPYMVVADHIHGVHTDHTWYEVAALLRVDLPWWSPALRDVDAIAAWQPGAPVQRLLPRGAPDPRRLRDLLTPCSSEYVTALVGRIVEQLHREAVDGYIGNGGHDSLPARLGLIHAAIADTNPSRSAPPITAAESKLLMHQPCPNKDAAEDTLELLAGHNPIVGVSPLRRDTANVLAQEWISRRLAPADDATELGFWRVRLAHQLDAAASTVYRDQFSPHTWIVTTDDTIYAAAARSVPATGQLVELHYYGPSDAFFRDSIGQVWPLPATGTGATATGPTGGRAGRQTLVKIITNLLLDASGDVTRRAIPYRSDSPLAVRVATTPPPLVIRPGDPILAIDAYR